jgi:hypothetical protein
METGMIDGVSPDHAGLRFFNAYCSDHQKIIFATSAVGQLRTFTA